ncbi:hypothetical protein NA57DRAFT_71219 [Rhizodiscina lignyota]|uniref:Polyketide synthase n=1 Tax=Rhizodiscina lignyota TaxID=1504668 RepID=A0A9P4MH35_9PEZI|nr:hypothetical protein NA57DRAFT_71219 [Rhizodiscina lignyota]
MAPLEYKPIAIVGMALRGPGDGSDPEKFWQMLKDGRSARVEIPKDRFNAEGFYHPDVDRLGSVQSRHGHFLEQDFRVFDAPFFSITPKEARAMDPAHRMLLEATYEAFENAGLSLDEVSGSKTSCYIGTFTGDFVNLQFRDNAGPSMYRHIGDATGLSNSLASNRLSWFYNLRGPSMTMDTACSSSLSAFHLGCQSIRTGEAKMSVVGGANLVYLPDMSILLGAAKILSPEGKSKMWDASANGFARGEGFGITVLKSLEDAVRDGDTIRGVVLASAANEDGRTPGISLPSSEAQEELIRTVYELARVPASETGYVEAHGTGGRSAGGEGSSPHCRPDRTTDLYVGSVKTNVGHLEGAAGIAGVIKATLVAERGLIPQNIWFEKLNPQIELPENVKVPLQLTRWPGTASERRVGVNSFGFGGANVHVLIQDAASYLARNGLQGRHATIIHPTLPSVINSLANGLENGHSNGLVNGHANGFENGFVNGDANGHTNGDSHHSASLSKSRILVLSSHDREGVSRNVERLIRYLDDKDDVADDSTLLNNLAYTLSSKRSVLPWKSFVVASGIPQLREALSEIAPPVRSSSTDIPKLALVFTGQGAQWFAMGKGLYVFKAFHDSMWRSETILTSLGCPWSLLEELGREEADSKLRLTDYSQPACTALQIALVDLLAAWGVRPFATVGHSSGEIAAAYCAGLISHEAAIEVAWLRGQVSAAVSNKGSVGGMLAVGVSADSIEPRLATLTQGKAIVGCYNSSKACTISGDKEAIDELQTILQQEKTPCARLPMNVAYHSFHMESATEEYQAALASVPHEARNETIPMFSSVTGQLVSADRMKPSYWVGNLAKPVNFVAAMQSLMSYSGAQKQSDERKTYASIFLEVGPHSALRSYMLDIFGASGNSENFTYATMLRRKFNGMETALKAMGQLWAKGCSVRIEEINENEAPLRPQMLVDLPPYAWNHSTTFWDESHLSLAHRQRSKPRTDLLGSLIPGTPDPTWRNFLRCRENPWIREHRVQGSILYPGAGMIVMAVEACKELAAPGDEIHGYELRDVMIENALQVPDNEKGIEVLVQLHPRRTGTKSAPSSSLNEFVVSSWSDNLKEWTTHARGLVSVVYHSSTSPAMEQELGLEAKRHMEALEDAQKSCMKPVSSFLYDTVETVGMYYGPTFRNITELFAGPGASFGAIKIPNTKAVMPLEFEYDCVIHPATLDSTLHLLFPSISGGKQTLGEAVVPVAFDRVFISNSTPTESGVQLHGFASAQKTSYTTWMSSITVMDEEHSKPLIVMEGLRVASVGSNQTSTDTRASCFEQVWREDVDLLEPSRIKELVYTRTIKSQDDDSVLDKLEYVCLVYIHRILDWFHAEGKEYLPTKGFFSFYVAWMQEVVQQFDPLPIEAKDSDAIIEEARKRIVRSNSGDITLQMVDRIGENLANIFSSKIEPLQVMTEGDLLYQFYRGAFGTSFNTNVAEYVGLIADKAPGLSILEIGAGTGGTTFHLLERLRDEDGTSRAGRYVFTDISPGFLAKAQERFAKDAGILEFKTLNIENDPEAQGFQPSSFDLIVAANVLHATKDIQETLSYCLSLLKPGGKLVLSEVTIKRIFSGFIMGTLPGWWLSTDGRNGGPLLDVAEWDAALTNAGFSGVDMDVRGDCDTSKEPVSLIVSTKVPVVQPQTTRFAIIRTSSPASVRLAEVLREKFLHASVEATVLDWDTMTADDTNEKYCLSLVEWETPLLANLTEEDWEKMREAIYSAAGTLWITGGAAMETTAPLQSLMVGLSRAIRNENAGVLLANLDIDPPNSIIMEESAPAILRLALEHSRGKNEDGEYAVRGQTVFVPRTERAPKMDKSLRIYEGHGEPEPTPFNECGRPLKLVVKTPGLLDTFRWVEDETYHTDLPEDWIELRVKAVGLNFKDVLVALGNLNEQQLGVDVSGIVTRVGAAVTDFRPGDRVMSATGDAFATFVRFPSKGGIRMPDDMSFEDAASMPLVYLTAYQALVAAGNLVNGESILVHAAAGGVGQAALIIAQQIGAEIFATVGTDEKRRLLMDEYGIPEDHIFSSRDTSFAKGIMRMTKGRGVDVVLNSLAGEALRLSWHCLADWGRFLEIGKADLFANTGLDMKPFLDNKSYIGVNLIAFNNNPTPRAIALWDSVSRLIQNGSIKPVKPIQLFTFAEVEKAFRYMQTGKHSGKIVVRVDGGDVVPAVPRTPLIGIRRDATYVIAGVGGICREIGRWLAEKGAGHLVLLSRSAASRTENIAFAADLRKSYGVNVLAFDCDVSDRASLQSVLENCRGLPEIKGCVTGAMVLDDSLFEKMTAAQVRTTVGPKVHGTVNLHELLPKELDFFVMLSSLAGVMGHRGQGNYGCGNIFQDAFASYRRTHGLRAMSIDIGYLLSTGFVAEHNEYVNQIKAMGLKIMHDSDLHGLLSIAMEGHGGNDVTEWNSAQGGQVMCGLPYNEYSDDWYWIRDGRFAALRSRSLQGSGPGAGSSISLREELGRCGSVDAAADLITTGMVERLARLMMMPVNDIDAGRSLSAYGVDSLVAVEVRNWIAREIAVDVSVFDIMANTPMRNLAAELAGKTKLLPQTQ